MAQPVWITTPGSLGTIPEGVFYQIPLQAYDPSPEAGIDLYYKIVAGSLPAGIQIGKTGLLAGVPQALAVVQGARHLRARPVRATRLRPLRRLRHVRHLRHAHED